MSATAAAVACRDWVGRYMVYYNLARKRRNPMGGGTGVIEYNPHTTKQPRPANNAATHIGLGCQIRR